MFTGRHDALPTTTCICGVLGVGGLAKGAGTSLASPDPLRAFTPTVALKRS